MRIAILSARYPPDFIGGGEISTQTLANALAARGHTVTVFTGAREDRIDRHGDSLAVYRSRVLLPWWGKPLSEARVSRETARALTRLLASFPTQPDVIHAHDFRSALTLSLLAHPRRVATVRDYAPICGTTNNLWWDGCACTGCTWSNVLFRCHRVAEASLARKPFRVWQYKGNLAFRNRAFRQLPAHIYTSRWLKDRVAGRLPLPPSVQTAVIPNPIDDAWLDAPLAPLPQQPTICVPGRLETTKGTGVLLAALPMLRAQLPDVRVHLVGGGEVERFQKLARALRVEDLVTFHGRVSAERVRELIDASAIVVSPHVWEEPFGRAALEAGARARPLVASDSGGVRETTTPETAVLVRPNNPRALANALSGLLRAPERLRSLGNAARRLAEEQYRASTIAAFHEHWYATVHDL